MIDGYYLAVNSKKHSKEERKKLWKELKRRIKKPPITQESVKELYIEDRGKEDKSEKNEFNLLKSKSIEDNLSIPKPQLQFLNFNLLENMLKKKEYKFRNNEGASRHKNRLQQKFRESLMRVNVYGLDFGFDAHLRYENIDWSLFDLRLFEYYKILDKKISDFL